MVQTLVQGLIWGRTGTKGGGDRSGLSAASRAAEIPVVASVVASQRRPARACQGDAGE